MHYNGLRHLNPKESKYGILNYVCSREGFMSAGSQAFTGTVVSFVYGPKTGDNWGFERVPRKLDGHYGNISLILNIKRQAPRDFLITTMNSVYRLRIITEREAYDISRKS